MNYKALFAIIFPLVSVAASSQADTSSQLYKTIKTNDSLLFTIGFNTCDIQKFESLVSDSFEFYHDKASITASKAEFIKSIKDGLCKLSYKPRRKLNESSVEVYPLEKDGVLYGAIQMGEHWFFAIEEGKPAYLTSTAKFTHVWLLENGQWKLSRGLSYDHKENKTIHGTEDRSISAPKINRPKTKSDIIR